MSGVYFARWLYSYFPFQKQTKKNQTLQSDLDKVISKLKLDFHRLNKTREQLTNKL